ncbi:Matrixin [Necator americanus]|uniref:Matrixin n=1 Tax=Necator americanus TaxID=51031 RepID=W2T540_NECAM|nr:Matrixin [Necator americanus]ETN76266.1 Matrixin [Necator americanus]
MIPSFRQRHLYLVVRKKRWRHNLLTWRIDTSNIKKEDEYVVSSGAALIVEKSKERDFQKIDKNIDYLYCQPLRATLHRAFQEWSAVSNVRFEEVADKSADIVIGFERGKHQDDFPFDGKDGIVAHAFYPRDGRLHFDADEDWSLNSATGTAVHEIGHLLGLEHSVDPRAVMYPAKRPYNSDFTLEDDDVRAVRILFPSEEEFKTYEKKKSPHLNEADRDRETNLPVIVENLLGGLSQEKFNSTNMEFIFPFPLPQLHQK